jgi:hypothetical protein
VYTYQAHLSEGIIDEIKTMISYSLTINKVTCNYLLEGCDTYSNWQEAKTTQVKLNKQTTSTRALVFPLTQSK